MSKLNPDYIIMFNGRAVYARYRVLAADVPDGMPESLAETLCIDEGMKNIHLEMLAKMGIEKVQVEEILEPEGMAVTRMPDGEPLRYASRTEILDHVVEGKEPESLLIPRLKERLAGAEAEAQEARQVAQAAEGRAAAAEERAIQAEVKAIQAEEKAIQAETKAQAAEAKVSQVEKQVGEIGKQIGRMP